MFNNKVILITGGTGSFGKNLIIKILKIIDRKKLLFTVVMKRNNLN